MINWIRKLFCGCYLRKAGQAYAIKFLNEGGSIEGLEVLVERSFDFDDFNDFERGILDVVRS